VTDGNVIFCQFSRDKVERGDFSHFRSRDFAPMNILCDRGQKYERLIYDRSKAILECFELPFDAPPPPMPATP
jgi:hypothetical protein